MARQLELMKASGDADMTAAGGIDLEITDAYVKINGTEVFVPYDSRIEISPITFDDVVTATITLLVRSLTLGADEA